MLVVTNLFSENNFQNYTNCGVYQGFSPRIYKAFALHCSTWSELSPWAMLSANRAAWCALSSSGAVMARIRAFVSAWVCVKMPPQY